MEEIKSSELAAGHRTGRFALCLSYSGSRYYGWQSQKNDFPTVQQYLEDALSKVANHPVEVVCAGRTDKGVHGAHQVVHFDSQAVRNERAWVFGCNTHLPKDISVSRVFEFDTDFHARFSALSRRYHYVIYNHPIRPAIFRDELTWCHDPLNDHDMHLAAQALIGEHDFTSFRAVGCQSKTPFRFIEFVNVKRYQNMVVIDIKGNAFLHHMVRNIAGVLMDIGKGRRAVSWCKDVLEARDRTKAGVTAAPNGLFLSDVVYPERYESVNGSGGPPSIIQAMIAMSSGEHVASDIWKISRLDV